MARINFEDSVYKNINYSKLLIKVGDEYRTKGMLLTAWELAQIYWIEHKGIPIDRWPVELNILIDYGFARTETRASGGFIYVSGSAERCKFLVSQSEKGKRGGKSKSAKKLSNLRQFSKPTEAEPKQNRNPVNPTEVSYSNSFSNSKSIIPYSSNTGEIASQSPEILNQDNSITVSSGKKPEVISGEDWNPVAIWMKAWGEKYKSRYPLQGKDTGSLKAIRKNFSLEQAEVLIAAYLSIGKPLYADNRHPLSLFFRDLPLIAEAAQTGNNPHISPEDAKKQKKDALLKKLKGEESKNDLRKIFE